MRACALVAVLVGCGGEVETVELTGAPAATRALGFDTRHDRIVAIGGASAFGLASLQVASDGGWRAVADVGGFDARAQLLGGGSRPLSAISQSSTLYRSSGDAAAPWSRATIPPGATAGTMFGVDDAGHVYGLDLSDPDGGGAVVRWLPGMARWDEVAGTRPLEVDARGHAVEADGRVTWVVPSIGLVRVQDGRRETVFACADCGLTTASYDDAGTLTALACPVAVRIAADGAVVEHRLPDPVASCDELVTSPDGTSVIASYDDAGAGSLWALPRAGGWRRLTDARTELRYTVRDGATAFGHGDGLTARGIVRIEF